MSTINAATDFNVESMPQLDKQERLQMARRKIELVFAFHHSTSPEAVAGTLMTAHEKSGVNDFRLIVRTESRESREGTVHLVVSDRWQSEESRAECKEESLEFIRQQWRRLKSPLARAVDCDLQACAEIRSDMTPHDIKELSQGLASKVQEQLQSMLTDAQRHLEWEERNRRASCSYASDAARVAEANDGAPVSVFAAALGGRATPEFLLHCARSLGTPVVSSYPEVVVLPTEDKKSVKAKINARRRD